MGFRDRRNQQEQTKEIVQAIVETIPNIKKIVVEQGKKEKEIPEWKKILQEKKLEKEQKAVAKKTAQPAEIKEEIKPENIPHMVNGKKVEDTTKLALIGTTDTATTFRSIVKKKRLTITEVLENLLTNYIKSNEVT